MGGVDALIRHVRYWDIYMGSSLLVVLCASQMKEKGWNVGGQNIFASSSINLYWLQIIVLSSSRLLCFKLLILKNLDISSL